MDEGDTPNSKVVRLPRNLDATGGLLRKDGPCYICGQPTAYRYSVYHGRYGDAWIDKQFGPAMRAYQSERLKSGAFLRWREQGRIVLGQLLKFVCRSCLDEMKERLWPEAEERERAEAQKRIDLWELEAQRRPPRPAYEVRMVVLQRDEIEIRCGDCVIGALLILDEGDLQSCAVILDDGYPGTGDAPNVVRWPGRRCSRPPKGHRKNAGITGLGPLMDLIRFASRFPSPPQHQRG